MESIIQIRHTAGALDVYGVPTRTSTELNLMGSVTPRTSETTVGATETTITNGLTLYLPSNTQVQSDDLFRVRNETFEVDGEAFNWVSGLGTWAPGVVVDLKKMTNG